MSCYYLTDTELRLGAMLTDVHLTDAVEVEVDLEGLVIVDVEGYLLDAEMESTDAHTIEPPDVRVYDETDERGWPYTSLVLLSDRAVAACRVVE